MRNIDRDRVLAAQLSGVAAGVAHTKRCTVAEGLAEVAAILAQAGIKPGSVRAIEVLTLAAVMYVGPRRDPGAWWFPQAAAFLVEAGDVR